MKTTSMPKWLNQTIKVFSYSLLAASFVYMSSTQAATLDSNQSGFELLELAPDIQAVDHNGNNVSLRDVVDEASSQGKIVAVQFCFLGCPYCRNLSASMGGDFGNAIDHYMATYISGVDPISELVGLPFAYARLDLAFGLGDFNAFTMSDEEIFDQFLDTALILYSPADYASEEAVYNVVKNHVLFDGMGNYIGNNVPVGTALLERPEFAGKVVWIDLMASLGFPSAYSQGSYKGALKENIIGEDNPFDKIIPSSLDDAVYYNTLLGKPGVKQTWHSDGDIKSDVLRANRDFPMYSFPSVMYIDKDGRVLGLITSGPTYASLILDFANNTAGNAEFLQFAIERNPNDVDVLAAIDVEIGSIAFNTPAIYSESDADRMIKHLNAARELASDGDPSNDSKAAQELMIFVNILTDIHGKVINHGENKGSLLSHNGLTIINIKDAITKLSQ